MDSDNNNMKKILCNNIISGKKCNYGNKCLYAHSLDEQNVNPIRAKVYDILSKNNDLSDINLIEDNKLYEALCQLTKVCSSCERQICNGGKNCRNGAISKTFKICYDDLVYGNCKYAKCNFVHLTNRGLVAYLKQKNKAKHEKMNLLKNNSSSTGVKNYFQYKFNYKKNKSDDILKNTDDDENENNLVEYLFMTKNLNVESSDSYADENIDDIIEYLNNDNDSSDESIFLV